MKFINREKEIAYLEETKKLAKNKLFTLSIFGLRRVGKTRLITKFLNEKDIYFFVNKDKTSESLLKEYEFLLKTKRITTELEIIKNWEDFFKILFERFKGILAFDEFQNFNDVDPTVFGILQKNIDMNENKKGLLFIFSGSMIGMIKRLFLDSKEPLYGRIKRKLELKPLDFSNVIKICKELKISNFEEIVKLYSIFGGFPKYYVSIEDENLKGESFDKIMEKLFFIENATLEEEVTEILSLELGKRSGIYYDILTAIANGCTRIGEIASFLNKKQTTLTRQLNELVNYFQFIGIEKQPTGKKRLFFINHPLINFWFRFFYKNLSAYKRRESWLIEKIKKELNAYIALRFEQLCKEFLVEKNLFDFTKVGKQWGKIPNAPKDKSQYDIDIVALNEKSKEILFAECKWQSKVNAKKIIQELAKKASYVDWHKGKRKESFAIFAKSFSKRIKSYESKPVICFDMKDIEKALKK